MNSTVTESSRATTSARLAECRPGPPRIGIDLAYEAFFDAYKYSFIDQMVDLLGDGPVYDPWLDPDDDGHYPDLETWVAAGNEVTDRFYDHGYGMGEPFRIFTTRRNEFLQSHGITDLTLTLDLWVNQDCELRVEVHSPVASPDPCLLETAFPDAGIDVCSGPFRPTTHQLTVWTGPDMFAVGGRTGALDWRVKPETFLYDPSLDRVRPTAEVPVDEGWTVLDLLWVDDRALVIGQPLYEASRDDYRPSILAFHPERDQWTELTVFPDALQVVGAVVSTGRELILAGGGQNQPSDQVWIYSLSRNDWTQLQDTPLPPVELTKGVWTGSEAVFIGGYAGVSEFVRHAYNPATNTWRVLPDHGLGWIEYHDLYWTGQHVIVAPMDIYTDERGVHNSSGLLLYDPVTDSWSESAEMPIAPTIRGAVTWTGSELLFWGGFDADWHATSEGAAYDPSTDVWRVLAESPLSARTDHSGTWTGSQWVIIGGSPDGGTPGSPAFSDGAIYDPATDTWEYLGG